MTTSKGKNEEAFVWIWLPNETEPVVAGRLTNENGYLFFNYGQSYLKRTNAIPIYDVELPLRSGLLPLLKNLNMPGCIRDAAPDAWGRRVIINKMLGLKRDSIDTTLIDELTYLLESGSDRVGALDFQRSATVYEPRLNGKVSLDELLDSAARVEKGIPLSPELDKAIQHGSSIGGARPKAMIVQENKKFIAKFSSNSDVYNVVKAEFVAMRLAKKVGLNVADVSLVKSSKKDVCLSSVLTERFRNQDGSASAWCRRSLSLDWTK